MISVWFVADTPNGVLPCAPSLVLKMVWYARFAPKRFEMTDRKNLKIAEDTYEELKDEKRQMETWDSFLRRLLRE